MAIRKIIQVTGVDGIVVALCNDGTVWQSAHHHSTGEHYEWRKFKDIPQADEERKNTGRAFA